MAKKLPVRIWSPRRERVGSTGEGSAFTAAEVGAEDVSGDSEVLDAGIALSADDLPDGAERRANGAQQQSVGHEGPLDGVVDEVHVDCVGKGEEEYGAEVLG